MGSLSPIHWLIIVLVFVLLFGSKRLPDAARGLGKSLKIIKNEMKELTEDDQASLPSKTTSNNMQIEVDKKITDNQPDGKTNLENS